MLRFIWAIIDIVQRHQYSMLTVRLRRIRRSTLFTFSAGRSFI